MAERYDSLAVEAHLLGLACGVVLDERAGGAEAGVVDEEIDLDPQLVDPLGERCCIGGEIAGDHLGVGGELASKALEAIGSAGHQDEIVAASGELARKLFANSRGCAGDEA